MDINLQGSSNPMLFTPVGNTTFFAADDGVHGVELWKTDGTAAGTTMVKDIRIGARGSAPYWLTAGGNMLFFTANDGQSRNQVWKSDGTAVGTVRVTNIANGLHIHTAVAVGSRLFFFNDVGTFDTTDLYVTDGTSAGTRLLISGGAVRVGDWQNAVAYQGKLYFLSEALGGDVLWVSDGTKSGTHPMPGSPPNGALRILPASGRNLYFTGMFGQESVWKTDGTAAGTKPLVTVAQLNWVPVEAAIMAQRLYFPSRAWDPEEQTGHLQFWKSDGTVRGTKPLFTVDVASGGTWLVASGNRLFFRTDQDLWVSDGTADGTQDLGTFGTTSPQELVDVAGTLCFIEEDDDANTWSLWVSEGTAATTRQVGSFVNPPGVYIPPDYYLRGVMNSTLFFYGDDGVHGAELWSYTP